MCAFPDMRRCGRHALVSANVPRTLICCIRSNRFIDSASVPSSAIALALFTQMSMPPKCSTAVRAARSTSSSLRTSPTTATALPPAASISATAVCTVPGSFGCGSLVLASSAAFAPSLAAASAMARPIPRLPPDMTIVRPRRSAIAPPITSRRPALVVTS